MPPRPLLHGIDYYLDAAGRCVFTEKYHRERGYCCGSGCRHCPYGFGQAPSLDREAPREKPSASV